METRGTFATLANTYFTIKKKSYYHLSFIEYHLYSLMVTIQL